MSNVGMASYNSVMSTTAPRMAFGASVPMSDSQSRGGTFAPGTKIQVGSQKVVIQNYFSEGGFAHVYIVKMPKPIDGTDIAILKRVAVPDKEHLASMRVEVETMKKLKGHRPIVTYYDSHASELKGGGYEVFLLMEFCNGGGLIDFMNTRLQNRLTEPEILKIFSDVAEGVACMHYLKPPLLHRDLKVENVLITTKGGSRRYKLCDFGSTAPPKPVSTTAAECRLVEEDIQKHTTLQYRSPEMVDVYRKLPIDEKSDIWALGVLLYKLCYYTTPFESQGQLAILNASFKFPGYPHFSESLKRLIASMLQENPRLRPNIYEVLRGACLMQGIEVPIKDIYNEKTTPATMSTSQSSVPDHKPKSSIVGATFSPPLPQQAAIPDVIPMRRGRPTKDPVSNITSSPMRKATNDPWAVLNSSPKTDIDEISSRFPSLDEFSLFHHEGDFDFGKKSSDTPKELQKLVTEQLADNAFVAQPKLPHSKAQEIISSNPDLQAASTPVEDKAFSNPEPLKQQTKLMYVSQGTMTTNLSLPTSISSHNQPNILSNRYRSASLTRNQEPTMSQQASSFLNPLIRPAQIQPESISLHPSLESLQPLNEPPSRAKSTNSRTRPTSTYLESNIDFLREKELTSRAACYVSPNLRPNSTNSSSSSDPDESVDNRDIESKFGHLQISEADRNGINQSKTISKTISKSNSSSSLGGSKILMAGKFGDAFKLFEQNSLSNTGFSQARIPSPLNDKECGGNDQKLKSDPETLPDKTLIRGATRDESLFGVNDDMLTPEERREVERRRLSIEEKRVADAAAEYRKKLADREKGEGRTAKSAGAISHAKSIQNKVRNLLDENQAQRSSDKINLDGHYRMDEQESARKIAREGNPYASAISKPPLTKKRSTSPPSALLGDELQVNVSEREARPPQTILPSLVTPKIGGVRPSAPPKPVHLNHMAKGTQGPLNPYLSQSALTESRIHIGLASDENLIEIKKTSDDKEVYLADFSKRFPSLGSIEMVEREIDARPGERDVKSRNSNSRVDQRAGVKNKVL